MDTMRDRFAPVVSRLLDEDPRVAVVLAEIGADGFRETMRRHPDRVINVGIREQLLVGTAAGLALTGLRPVVHTFASFLVERPFEQVKLDLGHQDAGAVLVSAAASFDWPAGGFTHMAPGDVALLDTLDGWTVHVPGHPDEAETLLRHAVAAGDDKVYVRLSVQSNEQGRPVDGRHLRTVREGRSGVVVAVGPMLDAVLAATEGLDVTVLYATTVRPFDAAGLRRATEAAGTDVVLVEPYLAGTSTAAVSEALSDVPHRVLGLGVGRRELRRYGTIEEHVAAHGLDPAGLRRRIAGYLGAGRTTAPATGV
ncbi:transketolase C-terminal domain-containing protein [Streptomyces sp. NPDC006309]|uniref:transketolase family protein n=1 Tax=Streptomyces sp. NPDC006309 TaxID=3156749 RepID=UPI0033BBFA99